MEEYICFDEYYDFEDDDEYEEYLQKKEMMKIMNVVENVVVKETETMTMMNKNKYDFENKAAFFAALFSFQPINFRPKYKNVEIPYCNPVDNGYNESRPRRLRATIVCPVQNQKYHLVPRLHF